MVLICISPMISDVEHLFTRLLLCVFHVYVFFGKMSVQVFCPFFKLGGLFFDVELYELFIYVGYLSLIGHVICKYFLPFSRLSFCFIDGFLCCAKYFKSN